MLQRPKYRVSRANVFANRPRGATSAHIATSCPRYIVPMNTIHHRLHCAMHTDAGADYTFRIHVQVASDTDVTGYRGDLNLSHFILQDYTRVKLWEILTIPQLAPLRRIVKLRALIPLKTCFLRRIALPMMGTVASFPRLQR